MASQIISGDTVFSPLSRVSLQRAGQPMQAAPAVDRREAGVAGGEAHDHVDRGFVTHLAEN
jgi:hypothetical protein